MVVANAIAMRGNAERGHALHEARGKPAQAAVAERGIGLELPQTRSKSTPSSASAARAVAASPRFDSASNSMRPIRNSSEK